MRNAVSKAILGLLFAVLLCSGAMGQSLPTVVSYPSIDSGWSVTGNVQPLSCFGSACTYTLPDVWGNATSVTRTIGAADKGEQQNDEIFQVKSNGQDSFDNLLVNIPVEGDYIVTASVYGIQSAAPLGGQSTYPTMEFVVNGSIVNICSYPNATSITATSALLVNNPKQAGLHEYAYSCHFHQFAGNTTIGITIVGGQGHGGQLIVRHMMVYPWTASTSNQVVKGNVVCQQPGGVLKQSVQTGSNIFDIETNARSWNHTIGCDPNVPVTNLQTGYFVPGQGCNGTNRCALLQLY